MRVVLRVFDAVLLTFLERLRSLFGWSFLVHRCPFLGGGRIGAGGSRVLRLVGSSGANFATCRVDSKFTVDRGALTRAARALGGSRWWHIVPPAPSGSLCGAFYFFAAFGVDVSDGPGKVVQPFLL